MPCSTCTICRQPVVKISENVEVAGEGKSEFDLDILHDFENISMSDGLRNELQQLKESKDDGE